MAPEYRPVLLASLGGSGQRVRYVVSIAPGWRVTVLSGAAEPTAADAERIMADVIPRIIRTYPRKPPGQPRLPER